MRGRPFRIVWAAADTPEAVKAAYQAERDPPVRTQLHGLWLLRGGWRLGAVAAALGVDYRSVQRSAAWYRAGREGGPAAPARVRVARPLPGGRRAGGDAALVLARLDGRRRGAGRGRRAAAGHRGGRARLRRAAEPPRWARPGAGAAPERP